MARIAYIDGCYQPIDVPAVSVEDRGYQFADAVYEVCSVMDGRLIDTDAHLKRLDYSLRELGMTAPMSPRALQMVMREVVRRNRLDFGMLYLQISRGVAPREHTPPPHIMKAIKPVLVMTAKHIDMAKRQQIRTRGISVVSVRDVRWARCDIKSVSLLGNVLARQYAVAHAAQEAWQIDAKGKVSEGASANAWIVDKQGILRTAPAGASVLNGTVRRHVLDLAKQHKIPVKERAFTIKEALAAQECFSTSSTMAVVPVVRLDGRPINKGKSGGVTRLLGRAYDALW